MNFDINMFEDSKLPQCVVDFINYLEVIKGKSPNTLKAYEFDLTLFFRFLKLYKKKCSKNLKFDEIIIVDVDCEFLKNIKLSDLYAFLSFVEKYRANGSYARARKVACLKSFFKFLSGKASIIIENPALELESPKISKRNPVYLTLDESIKLLRCMNKKDKNYTRDYCILTIFLNCGLRVSELCSINISKIKDDTLTIIGKGNKERTVYLNDACLKAISYYLEVRNDSKVTNEEDRDALFLSAKNNRINKRTVESLVKKHTESAKLTNAKYTPHKLRHTAATLMYKHGNVDIRSLQRILGHENISTTQIYTHIDKEYLIEVHKSFHPRA
jgi:integrase/recombinase XerD